MKTKVTVQLPRDAAQVILDSPDRFLRFARAFGHPVESVSKGQPTVEELNKIQDEWMRLDPAAEEKERKRVFALMDNYPKVHLSVSADRTEAIVMVSGQPMQPNGIPLEQARKYCAELGGRVDVGWQGRARKWVRL